MTSDEYGRLPPAVNIVAVIDDEPLVRSAISILLPSPGYGCRTFDTGEDLLASDLDKIDSVLSDNQMPSMSGIDLVRRIEEAVRRCPSS